MWLPCQHCQPFCHLPRGTAMPASIRLLLTGVLVVTGALVVVGAPAAQADTRAMPGNFTGYAIDTCDAPSQRVVNAWRRSSKYAGDRHLRRGHEPRLLPASRTSPAAGSRHPGLRRLAPAAAGGGPPGLLLTAGLLPSTSGSRTVRPAHYRQARTPGRGRGARTAVQAVRALRIGPRQRRLVRPRALRPGQPSVPGLGDGLHLRLDPAAAPPRATGPGSTPAPPRASGWSTPNAPPGRAGTPCRTTSGWPSGTFDDNLRSAYISRRGWWPHRRVHQYRGGHVERHGGVALAVDSNVLTDRSRHAGGPARAGLRRPARLRRLRPPRA